MNALIASGGPLPIEGGIVTQYKVFAADASHRRVFIEYSYVDSSGTSEMSGYLSAEELSLEWWAPDAAIHNDCKGALTEYFGGSEV